MKKVFALVAMVATAYSLSANALLSECRIDYAMSSAAFLVEGGYGNAVAHCKDIMGNKVKDANLKIGMLGAGLRIGGGLLGSCTVTGSVKAVGPGFELAQLLGAMGSFQVGNQQAYGATVKVTPLAVDVQVGVSQSDYIGQCAGLADVQTLWFIH